jgi:alkylhydroperoxidase/carboxymuconolactone decarboxylase family protein YurZ
MNEKEIPEHYRSLKSRFPKVILALEDLGKTTKAAGPLDEKTSHLMQLVAASALQSEGAVHSHARRALEAGANPDELYHCILVLISTIGFPKVAAAVSWVDDVVKK